MLPERHSAGLSETVARASAGALEHVRVARVGNLVQALEALKARGIWVVGFDAAGSERWDAVDLTRPVALVLGGEGRGIRRLVREHCDHLVSIPHFGHIGSLNVSVAAGIALYEVVRQRRSVPSGVRPIPARPHASPQIVGPAADDAETDPGRPSGAAAGDDGDDAASDVAAASVRHVDLSDDVAWGQGPVILKPVGFDRPHRVRRPASQGTPPPAARAGAPRPAAGRAPRRQRSRAAGREGARGPGRAARRRAPAKGPSPAPPRTSRRRPRSRSAARAGGFAGARKAPEARTRSGPPGRTARRQGAAGEEDGGVVGGTSGELGIGLAQGGPVC